MKTNKINIWDNSDNYCYTDDFFDEPLDANVNVSISDNVEEEEYYEIDDDCDSDDEWFSSPNYSYSESINILDKINIKHIEKYLREKKLNNINKNKLNF